LYTKSVNTHQHGQVHVMLNCQTENGEKTAAVYYFQKGKNG